MRRQIRFVVILVVLFPGLLLAQLSQSQQQALLENSNILQEKLEQRRGPAYQALLNMTTGPQAKLNENPDIQLMGVTAEGHPLFYTVLNLDAAYSHRTDELWPGGAAGLDLSGAQTSAADFAIWDGGAVLESHVEFGGRVTSGDASPSTHYHSTHVAGTMIAAGVNSSAKGMSYQAELTSFDWTDDLSEMSTQAAAGLRISNHSYGFITGWYQDDSGTWYWYGDPTISSTEDYKFGYYISDAKDVDQIAYLAPNYLIVQAMGNDRNDYGPSPGTSHYVYVSGNWILSTDTRDADGGSDGYDSAEPNATSKNILSVGAIYDISGGYSEPSDVSMTSFSGWGPTDDGRIKPDLVANGYSLISAGDGSDTEYLSLNGTSMATPTASGSINLLREYYLDLFGLPPLSSTLKGLAIHTADESGSDPGPDYEFGWGCLNSRSAADFLAGVYDGMVTLVETTINDGGDYRIQGSSDGTSPIRVTIVWTDPPGTVPSSPLNSRVPVLVNDLDLRVVQASNSQVYEPWILDVENPSSAATRGDNIVDNVEQVYVESPAAGDYEVVINHKGNLYNGSQDVSIFVSGLNDTGGDPDVSTKIKFASGVFRKDGMPQATVEGFTNVAGVELHIQSDPIIFIPAPDLVQIHSAISGATVNYANNELIVVWADFSNPATLSDGEVLFSLDGEITGHKDEEADLKFSSSTILADANGDEIPANYLPGTWRIDSTEVSYHANLTFTTNNLYPQVSVTGFTRVAGVQLYIGFDESRYALVPDSILLANGMSSAILNVDAGVATVVWADFNNPLTLEDGELLLELHGVVLQTLTSSLTFEFLDGCILGDVNGDEYPATFVDGSMLLDVDSPEQGAMPSTFEIGGIYPNPFNPSMSVTVSLPLTAELKIAIYNLLGREVAVLADSWYKAGYHHFVFNAAELPSGIYFVHASVPGKLNQVRKVVLMK